MRLASFSSTTVGGTWSDPAPYRWHQPYDRNGSKRNNLSDLIAARSLYDLTKDQASSIVARIEDAIREHWAEAADFGRLTSADRRLLWGRQFLNPGTLYGFRDR